MHSEMQSLQGGGDSSFSRSVDVIRCIIHFARHIPFMSYENQYNITSTGKVSLQLCDFEYSYGFDNATYTELFLSRNKTELKRLQLLGGFCFENKRFNNKRIIIHTKISKEHNQSYIPSVLERHREDVMGSSELAQPVVLMGEQEQLPHQQLQPVQDLAPMMPPMQPNAALAACVNGFDDGLPVHDLRESFAAKFSAVNQQRLFDLQLKERADAGVIEVPCKNGRHMRWFHLATALPTSKNTWSNFLDNMHTDTLIELARCAGGTVDKGVAVLARRLYGIDPEAAMEGVRCGGGVALAPLTAVGTVALMVRSNINESQRIAVAQCLRLHNGGIAVLAGKSLCDELKDQHPVPFTISTYVHKTYEEGLENVTEYEYRVSSPKEAVLHTLRKLVDAQVQHPFGVNLGVGVGEGIGYKLLGDHGGSSMKFNVGVLAREADGDYECVDVGCIPGKEDCEVIAKTCAPVLNAGIGELNSLVVLTAQWDGGSDFVMLPSSECPLQTTDLIDRSSPTPPAGLHIQHGIDCPATVHWGVLGHSASFYKHAQFPAEHVTYKYLPLVPYLAGDIAFLMMVQGRKNHAGCKCPSCILKHTDKYGADWQRERRMGPPCTIEEFEFQRTEYAVTHPEEAAEAAAAPPALADHAAQNEGAFANLFADGAEPQEQHANGQQVHQPHALAQQAGNFNQAAQQRRLTAEDKARHSGIKLQSNMLSNIPLENHMMPILHIVLGLTLAVVNNMFRFNFNSVEYLDAITAASLAALQAAEQQVHASLNGTPEQKTAAAATHKKNKKDYKSMRETRKSYVVCNAMDKIFRKYGVDRQQYHKQALVGEGCERFINNWSDIRPEIQLLWLSNQRRAEVEDGIDQKIVRFLDITSVAVDSLFICKKYLYQSASLSQQQKQDYQHAAHFLGDLFRHKQALALPIPIKLHLLETHGPVLLNRFGSIRKFLEESIETQHHIRNVLERQFAGIKGFRAKEEGMLARSSLAQNSAVQEEVARQEGAAKRKLSNESLQRKLQKTTIANTDEEHRCQQALQRINNFVL